MNEIRSLLYREGVNLLLRWTLALEDSPLAPILRGGDVAAVARGGETICVGEAYGQARAGEGPASGRYGSSASVLEAQKERICDRQGADDLHEVDCNPEM